MDFLTRLWWESQIQKWDLSENELQELVQRFSETFRSPKWEYPCCEGVYRVEAVPGDARTLVGGICPVHGWVNRGT